MPAYHGQPAPRLRPFVYAPYLPLDGSWAPCSLPALCPWASSQPCLPCAVRLDHWRPRKTGPCFPLAVLRCRPHERAFTLYPCGFVPYAQVPLAPVTPAGNPVFCADEPDPAAPQPDEPDPAAPQPDEPLCAPVPAPTGGAKALGAWRGTLFDAALDAAAGNAWRRTGEVPTRRLEARSRRCKDRGLPPPPGPVRRGSPWRTQGRRLGLAAVLLGLVGAVVAGVLTRLLDVPELTLRDAARAWQSAQGYQGRGRALVGALAVLPRSPRLLEVLLAEGARHGRWGTPWRWDPSLQRLRPCVAAPSGVPP
jgi:hypothetical protein